MSPRASVGPRCALMAVVLTWFASPSAARVQPGDPVYEELQAYEPDVMARVQQDASARRGAKRFAIPDVFGPGSVLNVGNVTMKVSNTGIIGNPFITSSDPSCQWPGASAVEYMNLIAIAMGAVNPFATDPN